MPKTKVSEVYDIALNQCLKDGRFYEVKSAQILANLVVFEKLEKLSRELDRLRCFRGLYR